MILYVLFFLSGAAGLVYELLWVRRITLIMGGTTHAITTVLAAFMAGLALGSVLSGRRAARMASPIRTYALLEIGIGLSALLAEAGFAGAVPLYRFLYERLGPEQYLLQHAVRFSVSALLLLLPTVCMGATLPVLIEHGVRRNPRFGNVTGIFYGLNTTGAAAGAALAGFVLIPELGRRGALDVAVMTNLALGGLALLFRRRLEGTAAAPDTPLHLKRMGEEAPPGAGMGPFLRGLVLVTVGVSGFAAMAYQIGWTRVLLVQIGSSVYAFTSVLVVFILGLGLGALLIGAIAHRIRRTVFALGLAEALLGLSALWILPSFAGLAERVVGWLQAGPTATGLLAKQFSSILAMLIVPTFVLGTVFPLVVFTITRMHREASRNVGISYAVNTAGTILGSIIAGFFLLAGPPGIQGTLGIAIGLSAGLGVLLILADRGTPLRLRLPVLVVLLALFGVRGIVAREKPIDRSVLTAAPFRGSILDPGKILYYRDGADATVSIHEMPDGQLNLRINGKPDASTGLADMSTQVSLAQIPILLAPDPERVLIIGLGGGVTMASATTHGEVRAIDVLEISGEVIEGAREHFGPFTRGAFDDPRVRIIRNDGRNHLLLSPETYDVIISEPSNPWLAGIANLFTKEYFDLARSRLRPDGVYCQWLQSYGMAPRDFLLVVRTLLRTFPNVSLWQPQFTDFLLVAREGPAPLSLDDLALRMLDPGVYRDLETVGLEHPGRFLGACLADDEGLRAWAGPGPVNTDGNGLLEFSAPLHRLRSDSPVIAASIERHCGGALDGWLLADPSRSDHRSVLGLAARSRESIFAIYEATALGPERESQVAIAERLYRLDPADWRVFRMMMHAADRIEGRIESDRSSDPARARRILERIRSADMPPTGPLTTSDVKKTHVGEWLDEARTALDQGRVIDARELLARAALWGGDVGGTASGYAELHRRAWMTGSY